MSGIRIQNDTHEVALVAVITTPDASAHQTAVVSSSPRVGLCSWSGNQGRTGWPPRKRGTPAAPRRLPLGDSSARAILDRGCWLNSGLSV